MNDDLIPPGWLRRDAATFALRPEDRDGPADTPATVPPDPPPGPDTGGPLVTLRLDPYVPSEFDDRKPGWDAHRLVVLSDGNAWALPLPLVGDGGLDANPALVDAIRDLAIVLESGRRFLASPPAPSLDSIGGTIGLVGAIRSLVISAGLLLLLENYHLTGREALALLPAGGDPGFVAFQDAVVGCCSGAMPDPDDLAESEIDAYFR